MKNFQLSFLFLLFYSFQGFAQDSAANMSHESGTTHSMLNKEDIKWVDGPPGLPAGAKVFLLQGDPSKEGPFTLRAMFPANYKIPPHTHPSIENVVVLEGTLNMGSGDKFDEKSTKALAPGGFSSIPAEMPHFVYTKGKCVIQVHAMGPFAINYVNPEDDPRNKQ